jgi:ribulose-phosphate 3-epimerase
MKRIMGKRMTTRHSLILAPSILTADFGHLADAVRMAEAGGADYIHLDVMDGLFVPNISFGPVVIQAVRQSTSLPLDVHLMIEGPERYLNEFVAAGAGILTVQVEACKHLHRTVQQITALGCKAGIALNPATSVDSVREILPFVDQVLIMSVNPGFGSQRFIETSTSKLRRMRKLMDEYSPLADLQVDGGVDVHNISDIVAAGANVIVVGSSVFNQHAPVAENLARLREAALRDE